VKRILLSLLLALTLTGCSGNFLPSGHDVQMVELMETMGLDVGADGLTMTVSGGGREENVVRTGTGTTLSQALLDIQTQSDCYVSYGHVNGVLIGEDTAREGISSLLDFLQRDSELRLNTYLYVVRDGTAQEVLEQSEETGTQVADRLKAMELDAALVSDSYPYNLKDVLVGLEDNGCALIPALTLGEEEAQSCGYACLQNGVLLGWMEPEIARGVNLLENHVDQGTVTGTVGDTLVSVRLEGASCSWEPQWEGDTLVGLSAKIQVTGSLEEVQGSLDLMQENSWRQVEHMVSLTLGEECAEVLGQFQRWNGDFLHLKNQVELAEPGKKALVEENWERWFSELPLEVVVTCGVDRTFDIAETLGGTA
jgi:Ger(x)C family germination protein